MSTTAYATKAKPVIDITCNIKGVVLHEDEKMPGINAAMAVFALLPRFTMADCYAAMQDQAKGAIDNPNPRAVRRVCAAIWILAEHVATKEASKYSGRHKLDLSLRIVD